VTSVQFVGRLETSVYPDGHGQQPHICLNVIKSHDAVVGGTESTTVLLQTVGKISSPSPAVAAVGNTIASVGLHRFELPGRSEHRIPMVGTHFAQSVGYKQHGVAVAVALRQAERSSGTLVKDP